VDATYRQTRTVPRSSEESFGVTDFAPSSRLAVKGQIGPFPRQQQLPAGADGPQDPADQHCRAGTLISAAAADRPACRSESQSSGRTQRRHAETASGRRPPRSRRRPEISTLSGGASEPYPTAPRRRPSRLSGKHRPGLLGYTSSDLHGAAAWQLPQPGRAYSAIRNPADWHFRSRSATAAAASPTRLACPEDRLADTCGARGRPCPAGCCVRRHGHPITISARTRWLTCVFLLARSA
jgi:hypothetical protein